MKTRYKVALLFSFLVLFTKCGCDDDDYSFGLQPGTNILFFNAAVSDDCQASINYRAADIYGYPASNPIFGDHWQIGGHTPGAINEMPDLGINIIVPELETGLYDISNTAATGTAVVYYTDEDGNEYDSTDNNTSSKVNVIISPWILENIRVEISLTDDVEVFNATLMETKCISRFSYSYTYIP